MRILLTVFLLSLALIPVSAAADQPVATEAADLVLEADLFQVAPDAMAGQACKAKPRKDCYCPMVYDPVCGCDGQTYSNSCVAQCEGIRAYSPGPCA